MLTLNPLPICIEISPEMELCIDIFIIFIGIEGGKVILPSLLML
jgi:hypothetical protein